MTARDELSRIGEGLAAGRFAPFLGPETLTISGPSAAPASTRALAERLTAKVAVPGRIRNNVWAAAQYIESNRHRQTLTRLMEEIFSVPPAPNMLHATLALLRPPLIVDAWYDGTMAAALNGWTGWGQAQGVTRNGEWRDIWFRHIRHDGSEAAASEADSWRTVLYKPHGSLWPDNNFLLSDADYVEVLTEIDIQTPIPDVVKERRSKLGFVFLGYRFHDQMERTFARQVLKRSAGPHYAVLAGDLTKNEVRFLDEQNIQRLDLPLAGAAAVLAREAAVLQLI